MLQRLFIHNYALIEKADIDFDKGFSIITGETGAGKSILLGAIGLILGERADFSVLKNKEKKCIIEGEFNIEKYNLKAFFSEHDIDYESNSILRREINNSGKSRAFINDSPVKLTTLKEFGEKLINVHSQNQSHQLNDEIFITSLLDHYSDNTSTLLDYKEKLVRYRSLEKELEITIEEFQKLKSEEDYISFQFEEIQLLNLSNINFNELKKSVELSENQEKISSTLQSVHQLLDTDTTGILQQLNQCKSLLSEISGLNSDFENLFNRINSASIEMSDFKGEVESFLESSENSSNTAEKLALYDDINRLLQKHYFTDFEQLISFEKELDEKIQNTSNSDHKIEELKSEISSLQNELSVLADKLHKERVVKAKILENEIRELLDELVLPNAQIQFDITKVEQFKTSGQNKVKMLFNANLGGDLQEISKSASGGETSRLMLAIQYLLSKKKALSSLVFDEIDTGISGEIASKIGNLLQKMSSNLQVISITHLPQVASKGESHFKVFKKDEEGETKTFILKLSKDERITEIAKMLSGDSINDASIENAKSLLTF